MRLPLRQTMKNLNLLPALIVGQQTLTQTFSALFFSEFKRRPPGEAKMKNTQLIAISDVPLMHCALGSSALIRLFGQMTPGSKCNPESRSMKNTSLLNLMNFAEQLSRNSFAA